MEVLAVKDYLQTHKIGRFEAETNESASETL